MKKGKILARACAVAFASALAAGLLSFAGAQNMPDTIDIPVTFYDFHSDRSNPEFEQPHSSGERLNMVANRLDAQGKPQLGASPYRNKGVAHWFRDWQTYTAGPYSKGKGMVPVYNVTCGFQQREGCGGDEWGSTINHSLPDASGPDTAFINRVIHHSLPFVLTNRNTGMYEFAREGFFWIDGQGFGNEWVYDTDENNRRRHNFSFTMEMAFEFQYKPSMEFTFRGDDDVWVFIDSVLALDIGGIHDQIQKSFMLDNVMPANRQVAGSKHTLHVFYAERHTVGSNIRIQTNIVAPPSSVGISKESSTSDKLISGSIDKAADKKDTLYSVVRDDNGTILHPGQYECSNVTWTISGNGPTTTQTGCQIVVADSLQGILTISVTYDDKVNPPTTRTVSMNVKALPPATVHIQKTPEKNIRDKKGNLEKDKSKWHDDIYFNPADTSMTIYAVLRDKYGNSVGFAEIKAQSQSDWYSNGGSSWGTTNGDVATVKAQSSQVTSTATATKGTKGEGNEAKLWIAYTVCGGTLAACTTLVDTVSVGSKSIGQISVGPNPFIPGQTDVKEVYQKGSPKTYDYYKDVIDKSGGKGVLIAVDAPKPLTAGTAGGGKGRYSGMTPYGKVVIYDAVGNIVMTDYLYRAAASSPERSYAYVWDGKNTKGRSVGPGTYLVRVTGKGDGVTLFEQTRIGVSVR